LIGYVLSKGNGLGRIRKSLFWGVRVQFDAGGDTRR
jgi:hypothetical protein